MTELRCSVVNEKKERCTTTLEVTEPVAAKVKFICKNHTRPEQVRANGRNYDPVKDEYDKGLHFQDTQFDKDLVRAARPQGTSHIHRQGQAHDCEKSPEGTPNQP